MPAAPATIILDRIYAASRSDVIGADLVQVKIARPAPFKTKNAKGRSAVTESFDAIRALGADDARSFVESFKKDSHK